MLEPQKARDNFQLSYGNGVIVNGNAVIVSSHCFLRVSGTDVSSCKGLVVPTSKKWTSDPQLVSRVRVFSVKTQVYAVRSPYITTLSVRISALNHSHDLTSLPRSTHCTPTAGPPDMVDRVFDSAGIYRDQLSRYNFLKHPLWRTDPQSTNGEIQIGDVGYFYEGTFKRLFNVISPRDDDESSPDEFEPMGTYRENARTMNDTSPCVQRRRLLPSQSVRFRGVQADVTA